MLCWLHVGDLHITTSDQPNHAALHEIVAQANAGFAAGVDFVLLPGDNANEGTPAQYAAIRPALDALHLRTRVLPGDHDFHTRSLAAFYRGLGGATLPFAETVAGHRCLFLDIVSAGDGGPDFRLGEAQLDWLRHELDRAAPGTVVLFMHAYPRELRDCGDEVAALLARHRVLAVAMGHTHYNELGNDGVTVYSTVRSTGQVEEGPPGYALAAIDGGAVSWRFKPVAQPFPFCLVTRPADERLLTQAAPPTPGPMAVRARAWGDRPIARVTVSLDGGPEQPMRFGAAGPVWSATLDAAPGRRTVRVSATDAAGRTDHDTITAVVGQKDAAPAPAREPPGSDAHAVGAWPEKGIHGGQLGPNKNGRQW